ncbi:hypothetical protein HDU86_007271 [Geranomyces michiganensis]|nr:hypothetical protein HDU86_007271 [Geranomyces michiganensis]
MAPIPPAVIVVCNDLHTARSSALTLSTTATQSDLSAQAFLLAHPPGGYTAFRTAGGPFRPVFLAAHIRRLCETVRKVFSSDQESDSDADKHEELLRDWGNEKIAARPLVELMHRTARVWVEADAARRSQSGIEVKITVLVTWSKEKAAALVAAHCDEMHVHSLPSTRVLVAGAPRVNPTAKGSQWVRTRAPLQAALTPPYTECILTDVAHNLYEGLTSNFCVLVLPPNQQQQQQPYIACAKPKYILMGTVLQIVMDACNELGVPFRWEFPSTADQCRSDDAGTVVAGAAGREPTAPSLLWGGAFLASTTRGVLPVNEIAFGDQSKPPITFPEIHPLISQLRAEVARETAARAGPFSL